MQFNDRNKAEEHEFTERKRNAVTLEEIFLFGRVEKR